MSRSRDPGLRPPVPCSDAMALETIALGCRRPALGAFALFSQRCKSTCSFGEMMKITTTFASRRSDATNPHIVAKLGFSLGGASLNHHRRPLVHSRSRLRHKHHVSLFGIIRILGNCREYVAPMSKSSSSAPITIEFLSTSRPNS